MHFQIFTKFCTQNQFPSSVSVINKVPSIFQFSTKFGKSRFKFQSFSSTWIFQHFNKGVFSTISDMKPKAVEMFFQNFKSWFYLFLIHLVGCSVNSWPDQVMILVDNNFCYQSILFSKSGEGKGRGRKCCYVEKNSCYTWKNSLFIEVIWDLLERYQHSRQIHTFPQTIHITPVSN